MNKNGKSYVLTGNANISTKFDFWQLLVKEIIDLWGRP
jgi:hypothetical protein